MAHVDPSEKGRAHHPGICYQLQRMQCQAPIQMQQYREECLHGMAVSLLSKYQRLSHRQACLLALNTACSATLKGISRPALRASSESEQSCLLLGALDFSVVAIAHHLLVERKPKDGTQASCVSPTQIPDIEGTSGFNAGLQVSILRAFNLQSITIDLIIEQRNTKFKLACRPCAVQPSSRRS